MATRVDDPCVANNAKVAVHVHRGVGFALSNGPIVVSCSFNGSVLATDPVAACDAPSFDCKLVWECEPSLFERLKSANVPIEISVLAEVENEIERIGHLLLDLYADKNDGSPRNEKINLYKLEGIKFEYSVSEPALLLSLQIEETPALQNVVNGYNEMNETARLKNCENVTNLHESFKNSELIPVLKKNNVIQIGKGGECCEIFQLSFHISKFDNIQLFLKPDQPIKKEDIFFNFVIFMKTLKIYPYRTGENIVIDIKSSVSFLHKYFVENPYILVKLSNQFRDLGLCFFDMRKIVPTNDSSNFLIDFCDSSETFQCKERCYIISCDNNKIPENSAGKKPFIDLKISLKFVNIINSDKRLMYMKSEKSVYNRDEDKYILSSEEDTNFPQLQKGENNKLMKMKKIMPIKDNNTILPNMKEVNLAMKNLGLETNSSKLENVCKESKSIQTDNTILLSPKTKEEFILKTVNELEDWMEKQKEVFKHHLIQKERNHLQSLKDEWDTKCNEHENSLVQNTEYCKELISNLNEMADTLKAKEIHLNERERKLKLARDEIELEYKMKYQDLKAAVKQVENDFEHKLKLREIEYSKLNADVKHLNEENFTLKEALKLLDNLKQTTNN